MDLINCTIACKVVNSNNCRVLIRNSIKYLVIHRTDLDKLDPQSNPNPVPNDMLDSVTMADRFSNVGLGTGGLIPYHFLIRANPPDFIMEQALPLSIRGSHAVNYNWRSIAIAVVGDFRKASPSPEQYNKLIELCSLLMPINDGLEIVGHTDLPGASVDPDKVCPGQHLPTKIVAAKAISLLSTDWKSWSLDTINNNLMSNGITL